MGEIANGIIDGLACSWCGIYFEKEHGFPVICRSCFKDWKKLNHAGKKQLINMTGFQVAFEKES